MPNDHAVAPATQRDLATMPIEQALDAYAPNFAAVLPPNITVDHFKRMVVTAININPDLMNADRRTLFNSCVKCASDGLLPDGREAALVIYKTKVKDRQGREQWIEAVQFMPMVAGIRKRLRNSGEVDSATAEVVYRKDRFKYRLGDGAFIEHEPPPLDEDRGDAIGAYAIIKLTSGETIREVMGIKEIEKARAVSRAKDSSAGPWVKWWSEMARKTVLRRAAKAAPQAATLEKLLMRDEETDGLPAAEDLPAIPARPRRESFALPPPEYAGAPAIEPDAGTYAVVDLDGVETEWETPEEAELALSTVFHEAAKRGVDALRGALESNDFREVMPREIEQRLAETYAILLKRLQPVRPDPAPEAEEDAFGLKPLPQQNSPAGLPSGSTHDKEKGKERLKVLPETAIPTSPAGDTAQKLGQSLGVAADERPASRGLALGNPGDAANVSDRPQSDLLGGPPAEDLTIPLRGRPALHDLDYWHRQLMALIAEAPGDVARLTRIRMANESGLAALKAGAPELYDETMAALHRKPG
jgi:recombination protein RecT